MYVGKLENFNLKIEKHEDSYCSATENEEKSTNRTFTEERLYYFLLSLLLRDNIFEFIHGLLQEIFMYRMQDIGLRI